VACTLAAGAMPAVGVPVGLPVTVLDSVPLTVALPLPVQLGDPEEELV